MPRIKTFHLHAKDKQSQFRRAQKAVGEKIRLVTNEEEKWFQEGYLTGLDYNPQKDETTWHFDYPRTLERLPDE